MSEQRSYQLGKLIEIQNHASKPIKKKFDVTEIKKVLFIIPPTFDFADYVASTPTNIATLAAVLEKLKYAVKVIDAGVDKIPFEKIIEMVKEYQPDAVALACNFSTLHNPSVKISKMIKKDYKNIPILIGGNHATAVPETILSDSPIDFVVMGEAEIVMPHLLAAVSGNEDLSRVNGLCISDKTPVRTLPSGFIKDLDKLPLPAYHLFDMSKYPLYNINSSRGCIFRCTYCASGVIYKRNYRSRSAKSVIEEIEYLIKNFGKKTFWFSDDLFGQNHDFVKELCTEIINRKLDITWSVVTRATTIPNEHLQLMKKAGCTGLSIGIESGDDEMLKVMKKDTTVDAFERTVPPVKKVLRARGFFLIGNIGETKENVWNTYRLIKKIKPDYGTFCPVVPLPGTELYNQLIEMDIIKPAQLNWDKFYGIDHDGNYDKESIELTSKWCKLTPKEIKDYCDYGNLLSLMVALGPVEIIKRMRRDGIKRQFRDDRDKASRLFRFARRNPRSFLSTVKIWLTA